MLAVDGGQSTIRVRHSDSLAAVEIEGVSRLEGDTVGSVASAVIGGWRAAGAPAVDRAVLGLTTAPSDDPARRRLCADVATGTGAHEVWLADDAVTAHAGALPRDWGVSVTAGTGVACVAMPHHGDPRIVGGHGYLLGDEGGAYWIGREGIRAVLRAADGRGQPTALVEPARRRFENLDGLGERLHSVARPVDAIAHFAPDVLEAAEAGDPVAMTIADEATDELVTLAGAAVSVIVADGDLVPVALGGRLLDSGPLRRRLDRAMARSLPATAPRSADGTPLDGALHLGGADDPGRYRDLVYVWQAA
ncbi:MAG: N-acetylglucosamine kinase [Chloroflexota bacterium]